ncbi:MAG: PAS domain S-box protein [Flammeovirgaceae bacterium]|nr:PAS domain S-box protein [Flammeovirgaceae bacterium]
MSSISSGNAIYPILEKLPVAVFEYTYFAEGRNDFTYISPYCEVLFGLTSETMLEGSLSLFSFIHPEERPSFLLKYEKWISNAENIEWEGRVLQATGNIIWVNAKANASKLDNGSIVWRGVFTDVSARKQAEQNMAEANQRLELAARGSDLGIWDYHVKTNRTFINDRWPEIVGYPKEELEEMFNHCEDFIHPDDKPGYVASIEKHLAGSSEYYETVYRFQLSNGGWKWILERGQVIERDLTGTVLRTAGTLQDFDQRKIEDQITVEKEGRYRNLLESLPLGVGIHQNGILVYANSRAAAIMGASSPEELLGKKVLDLVHPDYRVLALERVKGLLNGIPAPVVQEKFIRLDGKEIIVETSAFPFSYKDKPAIQLIIKDITEEFESKRAIRKSETLFTQLFHNSPFGKVMLDEKGKVLLVNQGFEKMFGFTQNNLTGKSLNEFIVPLDLKEEGNDLDSLISAKQRARIESFRVRKDGRKISVIIYGVPILMEDKTIGIFGSYVDISEQKGIEAELKVRNEELDNFVYKVSHDLRAPLSSVLGLVNLATLEGNDDNLADYVKIIGQKIKQLDNFISDVLSHSKNLKLDVKIEKIDLQVLIENSFRDLDYLKGADTIIKHLDISSEAFFSDKWRIGEIFRNLISNSIKYRDFEKPNAEISIKVQTNPDRAIITFSDNGIGISVADQNKVFDMFYRASVQSDGSGLGLYIVKNAIEKIGGLLKVTSQLGKGTTFELKLPNHTFATAIPDKK